MISNAYPESGRLARRWGHYAPESLMVAIVGVIVLKLRPVEDPLASLTIAIGLLTFILCTWLVMRRHDRGLCEHCMASMPLNASEAAVRYQRRFWLAHTGSEMRFVIPYLAVLIGLGFATTPVGVVAWVLAQTTMIYAILAYSTHRRLQPWCPWCSNGGGGQDETVTPDPLPSDHRQLV
jgi:hypothetical protein